MSDRFTPEQMAEELAKLVWSKSRWLEDFSFGRSKRPDHEIDTRRRELAVLQQAEDAYRHASKRKTA